ncbi:MAG: efflux RND transporter periplasmic adaptor subunit, partial [Alphaproteobacteria bacterium]|nr:efflux RND transporter periplasmic adaptor subunit [Alphaproteobacteria bacterium]
MSWLSKLRGLQWLTLALVFLLFSWVFSGEINTGGDVSGKTSQIVNKSVTPENMKQDDLLRVRVLRSVAKKYVSSLTINGYTEAKTRLVVKAETSGRILSLQKEKGAFVKPGDTLCQLDIGSRKSRLLKVESRFEQAKLDFDAANKLKIKGFTADTRVRLLEAQLNAAAASIAEVKLDIDRTKIKAPFRGIIIKQNSEIGEVLNIGSPCVTLMSYDPMLIVGNISERNILSLKPGMKAWGEIVTGEKISGKIRFVSRSAQRETRTFRVELEVPNSDNILRDGLTAKFFIPLPSVRAHKLDHSILVLNEAGIVGVHMVDRQNKVHFSKITIIGDTPNEIWV